MILTRKLSHFPSRKSYRTAEHGLVGSSKEETISKHGKQLTLTQIQSPERQKWTRVHPGTAGIALVGGQRRWPRPQCRNVAGGWDDGVWKRGTAEDHGTSRHRRSGARQNCNAYYLLRLCCVSAASLLRPTSWSTARGPGLKILKLMRREHSVPTFCCAVSYKEPRLLRSSATAYA